MLPENKQDTSTPIKRIRFWYGFLLIIFIVFVFKLFYVQVINHASYKTAALSDQLKEYQIPAKRGQIEINDANQVLPLVLNQTLYTLYADPNFIKNADSVASNIKKTIGGDEQNYVKLLKTKNTRYVILSKKLTNDQSDAILKLQMPGIDTIAQNYRTYPQGSLASQVLGFVNDDGVGVYGVEQALNPILSGKNGQVKAITATNGVPLASNKSNIEIAPKNGSNVVLTLDLGMQVQMEKILADQYVKTKSEGLSAVVIDPNNGQVKAMANYPTYDPTNYQSVTDPNIFNNGTVTNSIEPGSIMKTLTTAAALDQGVVQPDTTFYDPAHWLVDGFNITDIEQDGGARQQSISSILSLSLNTGATWLLMQMGGGQINTKAINNWYNYLVNKYRLGQDTNIEQGYESAGYIPKPNIANSAIGLTYANTSFGQGLQLTPLQIASALSSVINGGTYYQPTLVDKLISPDGTEKPNKPKVLENNVVSPKVSQEMIPLMENVVTTYFHEGYSFMNFPSNYIVGGKTGTAQIAQPGGGYYADKYNGTYIGFVGGNKPQYLIVVFNTKPNVPGYAGALAGQPVFADIAHMLINNGYVQPKS